MSQEIVDAVRRYAEQHYNDGGWDVVVECYDDADIAEVIGNVRSLDAAVKRFAPLIDIWSERQADARISSGEEV